MSLDIIIFFSLARMFDVYDNVAYTPKCDLRVDVLVSHDK